MLNIIEIKKKVKSEIKYVMEGKTFFVIMTLVFVNF